MTSSHLLKYSEALSKRLEVALHGIAYLLDLLLKVLLNLQDTDATPQCLTIL